MDKLDIAIEMIEEALDESNWAKIEEVYSLLKGQYEDVDGYNLDEISGEYSVDDLDFDD